MTAGACVAFLGLTPELLRHTGACLKLGREHLRDQWQAAPAGAAELERWCFTAARSGQDRPMPAAADGLRHGEAMAPAPALLTYADAAAVLSLSQRGVRRLVAEGHLPAVSIGTSKRIARQDLEDFVARLRQPSAAA